MNSNNAGRRFDKALWRPVKNINEVGNDYNTVINCFKEALQGHEIEPPLNVIADGKIHRCNAGGKNGRGDASYKLHLDGLPAGGFENHRDGQGWKNWHYRGQLSINTNEVYARRQAFEAAKVRREAEQERQYSEAAIRAQRLYDATEPVSDSHPYLVRKGVQSCPDLRQWRGRLVVPVFDSKGKIQSLQFINDDGAKKFLSAGRLQSGRFIIGDINPTGTVLVCEGLATGLTLHAETGYPVIVAFTCGNLEAVAVPTKAKYPRARLVICADDDHETAVKTGRNPGVEAANRAASACGGYIVIPPSLPGCSDWNDVVPAEKGYENER